MRHVPPLALIVAGVLLVVGSVAVWLVTSRQPADFGTVAVAADPGGAPAGSGSTERMEAPATGQPRAAAPAPQRRPVAQVATRSARLADVDGPAAAAEPVRVTLARLGIDAPVVPVGVLPDTGEMEIPDDVRVAGWYRYGVAPGAAAGNAVVTAHVDSRTQGRGAFFRLGEARDGDEVVVTTEDGEQLRYTVRARRQTAKDDLPAEVFDRSGAHRLVLITCGGAFDAGARRYQDNVIVVAEPTGG